MLHHCKTGSGVTGSERLFKVETNLGINLSKSLCKLWSLYLKFKCLFCQPLKLRVYMALKIWPTVWHAKWSTLLFDNYLTHLNMYILILVLQFVWPADNKCRPDRLQNSTSDSLVTWKLVLYQMCTWITFL